MKCRGCIHPPHLGTCPGRSGGTAYPCGCKTVTAGAVDDERAARRYAAAVWGPSTVVDTDTTHGVTTVRVWSIVANELRQWATRTYSDPDPVVAWRIAAENLRGEATDRLAETEALAARIREALS